MSWVSLVAMLAVVLPTSAVEAEELPPLLPVFAGCEPSHGWAAVRLKVDVGGMAIDQFFDHPRSVSQLALHHYDAEGHHLASNAEWLMEQAPTGAFARAEPAPGVSFEHETEEDVRRPGRSWLDVGIFQPEPRIITYLLVGAGDSDGWCFRVAANPGVATLLNFTRGTEAFAFSSRTMPAVAAAGAEYRENMDHVGLQDWGARAVLAGEARVQVRNNLVADYRVDGLREFVDEEPALVMDRRAWRLGIQGPDGEWRTCPCAHRDFVGSGALGPGEYRFTATGLGPESGNGDVWLAGADVVLPR